MCASFSSYLQDFMCQT
uniref:Uncharacterized protein n=1 Tax=Arundo donax TaxID=35708 RepID=A0A0A8ZP41_ARUDO